MPWQMSALNLRAPGRVAVMVLPAEQGIDGAIPAVRQKALQVAAEQSRTQRLVGPAEASPADAIAGDPDQRVEELIKADQGLHRIPAQTKGRADPP